jgi:hypothetical protein
LKRAEKIEISTDRNDVSVGGVIKFNYLSSTRDGKASGTVDSDYLANKLSHRSIEIISILGEDTGIGLHLSDGGMVRFVLKPNHAEAVYYLPTKK